jgi:1-deoxy-D-xylulose-5-phosphate reductoisomerase
MKRVLLLGSTGSIGTQTLDLLAGAQDRFAVEGLAAHSSWEALLEQVRQFRPRVVGLVDEGAADAISEHLPAETALVRGPESVERLADECEYDLAVHGVVGAAGVVPSRCVLERGRTLALANKESLVVAGELLMELSRRHAAPILPVDSEHAAIFQCLHGEDRSAVRRILLTASGGALRDVPVEELDRVTPEDALAHPTWDMGPRITVDSATLMNKALEIVEAHHLYGVPAEDIRVVLHRQSIVHSMVEFVDGSVLAQMSPPDMRGPIHFALHHPERVPNDGLVGFDLDRFRELTFAEPDPERFPCLELGHRCVRDGADSGAVLNAADEVAVAGFLAGEIGFQDIARINRTVLDRRTGLADDLEALIAADERARRLARAEISQIAEGRVGIPAP